VLLHHPLDRRARGFYRAHSPRVAQVSKNEFRRIYDVFRLKLLFRVASFPLIVEFRLSFRNLSL
jgi:hypothetical protein